MALTQEQVSQLYVALFGRASEGEGNQNWINQNKAMGETAGLMLATDAAKDYYGSSMNSNDAFIKFVYLNTFGKSYEDDKAGIDAWVAYLNDSGKSRGEVVAEMIVEAVDPKNAGAAQDLFNNKVEVSNYMAENVYNNPADWETSTAFKSNAKPAGALNVTSDPESVTAAEKIIDEMGGDTPEPVETDPVYLEVSRDNLKGTAENDLFVADVAQNASGAQVNTLGSGDVLDGKGGDDTLDATLITAYNVAGKAMDVTPTIKNIENITINAQISNKDGFKEDITDLDEVVLNARKIEGVEKLTSKYSDADLFVKNMTTNGVAGGTASQTVAMEYTANLNPYADEADMTVLYDQDYLVAGSQNTNGVYYDLMNQRTKDLNTATNSLEKFPLKEVAFEINDIEYTLDITKAEMDAVTTYSELETLLNSKLAASDFVFKNSLTFTTNGTFRDDENMRTGERIELVSNDSKYAVSDPSIALDTKSGEGNLYWNQGKIEDVQTNDPVKINVELEKVGLAADGGGLTIGSMNTDGTNVFEKGATTTDTREGFDQFDVTVKGNKTKNSSLSYLESTNNTLRKVTVESETRKDANYANLTIGNSNTGALIISSVTAADALKDVQVFDASSFKGDLTLNAGITDEIVEKYLKDNAALNLNGDLSLANEVALFDYKGGSGNDELKIFIENTALQTATVNSAFTAAAGVPTNVFEMDINGGAGNDDITVKFDSALVNTVALDSITNISINGGAGNDTINITSGTTATFTVAFNGNFGHDTIKGFNAGVVAVTEEKQTATLANGMSAHIGEQIVIKIGDTVYKTIDVTAANLDTDGIGAAIAAALLYNAGTNPTGPFTTSTYTAATNVLAFEVADKNVNSVTVEIAKQSEKPGTYDKDTTPIHTFTTTTTEQGGLYYSNVANIGADVLDFTAYNVKGVIVDRAADLLATGTDLTTVGNKFIWLEASAHDAGVYNVYEATSKFAGITTVDFGTAGAASATANNATKGAILGSIDLNDDGTLLGTSIVASQLVF